MQTILLYWFPAEQQTYTAKIRFFYAKFSAEFNEISLFFLKTTGSDPKMAITKVFQENAKRCRSGTKG